MVGDMIVKWKHEGTTTTKLQLGRPHLMTDGPSSVEEGGS
jgi:hypothetical protein